MGNRMDNISLRRPVTPRRRQDEEEEHAGGAKEGGRRDACGRCEVRTVGHVNGTAPSPDRVTEYGSRREVDSESAAADRTAAAAGAAHRDRVSPGPTVCQTPITGRQIMANVGAVGAVRRRRWRRRRGRRQQPWSVGPRRTDAAETEDRIGFAAN